MDQTYLAAAESDINSVTLTLGVISSIIFVIGWAIFFRGAFRMVRIIAQGQSAKDRWLPFIPRAAEVVVEFLAHTKMIKNRTVGIAHWFVMVGFLAGMVFWFESLPQTFDPAFHWPVVGSWPFYHLMDEILGIGTFFGILALIIVRQVRNPRNPSLFSRFSGSKMLPAYTIEGIVLMEGVGFLSVKAAKIATYGDANPATDFLTMHLATLLPANPTLISVLAFIKFLSGASFLILVGSNLTWGVAWHRFSAFFNIYFKRELGSRRALGAAKPMVSNGKVLTMENTDPDVDNLGAGKIEDFSWKGWLDFTTCTECGRCQSQCPAWNTGKPLSPKLLIMGLRDHGYAKAPYLLAGGRTDPAGEQTGLVDAEGNPDEAALEKIPAEARAEAERALVGPAGEDGALGGVIDPEVLWSCTTCGACVEQCPVDIEHVDHIVDMRRYQVLIESEFPHELAGLFKNLENKGNPWGQSPSQRTAWIDEMDIDIPVYGQDVESFDGFEYLFWVGCAGAFEDRAKKTTKAVAELLDVAAVNFLVLGQGETCTGDSARRAGNEFLFQMLAQQNIEQLDEVFDGLPAKQRKIVVTCAHCFNALGNEYPQVGGDYEVVHHTQLLNKLVREKRLVPVAPPSEDVTYHDPCYLGRHNQVYEAPRELIGASGATLKEMPRHLERSMCCGAGGARMWMEEQLGKRINIDRVDEALNTLSGTAEATPKKIATGCPFCRVMLSDGVTAQTAEAPEQAPEVVDVAQMLLESVKRGLPEGIVVGNPNRKVSDGATALAEAPAEAPASAPAAAPAAAAPAAPAEKKDAKPAVGLGLAGGGKRPGGPKKPGGAKPAAPAAETPAAEASAPAAPAKPAVGLGLAGGAKRPGAKKPGAAKPAAAPAAPAAETAAPAEAPAPASAPAEDRTVTTAGEAKSAGFGIAAGAKRPGAKKPGAAKPAPAPAAEAPAAEAPAAETQAEAPAASATEAPAAAPAAAPADDRTLTTAGESKAAGFGIAAGAKRPGARRPGAPKAAPVTDSPAPAAETPVTPAAEAPAPAEAPAEPEQAAPSAPETPADQPKAATGGSDRTLATEGESKAKGFGIAAGAKRPGGRK